MKIDNFYFVVENIEDSIIFYSKLLGEEPTHINGCRWADWGNENNQIYFGIISKEASESELIKGNNGFWAYTQMILMLHTKNAWS